MKKILSLILAFVFVAGICASAPITITANAASVDDLRFELNDDGDSYSVFAENSEIEGELVIPSIYNDLPVTCVGNNAFYWCTSLTSVTIPDSVISIMDYAFTCCENLQKVSFSKNLDRIGVSAFSGTKIKEVILYDGLTVVEENAFWETPLAKIILPKSLEIMFDTSFDPGMYRWDSEEGYILETYYAGSEEDWGSVIVLGDNDTPLLDYTFHYNASDYNNHYVLKENIEPTCTNSGVKTVSCSCGYSYTEEIEMLEHNYVGDSCNVCGRIAWDHDYGTLYNYLGTSKDVVIPESIDGEKINTIYGNCFAGNENIETITISESISYLNFSALSGIPNLKEIKVSSESGYYKSVDGVLFDKNTEILLKYPENRPDATYDIPDGVKNISVDAFSGNDNLKSVNIPVSVRIIGERAFSGCESLSNIVFSDEVQVIGEAAFYGTSLKSVTIPSNVTEIRNFAFGYCWNSKSYEDEKVEGFTIYGGKGTVAETYANENGFKFVEKVAHTHNYTSTVTKQPTCTTAGIKTFTCSCGDAYTEAIKATGHKEVTVTGKAATCTATGLTEGKKCSVCGTVTKAQQAIAVQGHKTSVINKKDATCTVDGYTGDTYCSTCKTTTEKGTVIKATGHKEVIIPAVAPTLTTVGKTEGKKCSVCGTVTVAQKNVAKLTLATPTAKVSKSAKGITVSWNAIENAEKYIVYQRVYNASTKKYSGWKALKTTTGLSYTDTTVKLGTIYSHTVKAVNGSVASEYTPTKGLTYNVTPTVSVANASNGVKVTWTTVANATGYRVYSSTYNAKTKKWSGWTNRGTAAANRTTWTDTKAKSGTYYKYTVRAVNGSVLSSYNKTGVKTLYLAQPTVKIANNASGMKVTWNKIAGSKGYTIYRAEYVNGAWSGWKNMGTIKNGSTVSWVDKSVKSGTTYRYTVRTVNGSYKSTYKASSGLLYLAQPNTTVKAVSNGITVNWTQSAGSTGYTVYRAEYNTKTKKWSGWKNMGTAKADKKSWTDKSAKKGVTYRYTVKAVNGKVASTYKASGNVKR